MTFRFPLQIFRYTLSAKNHLPDVTIKLKNLIRTTNNISRDFGSIRKCPPMIQSINAIDSLCMRNYASKTTNKKHRDMVRKQQNCDEKKPTEKRVKFNQTTKETCVECTNEPVNVKTAKVHEPKRIFNPTQMKWIHENCDPATGCTDMPRTDKQIIERKK